MPKHFFLITIIILLGLFIPTRYTQNSINSSIALSKDYDEMLGNATSDATNKLLEVTDNYSNELVAEGTKSDYRNINLNLDAALDRFYKTVYMNLNIEEHFAEQQSIRHRIPIKLAMGYDGFYVDYFKADGSGEEWSKIHKYTDVQGDNVIEFTLGDKVTVTNPKTKQTCTGTRSEVAKKFPKSCLKDEETFNKVRSQVINSLIQAELEYYTTINNQIAKQHGWNMNFDIPYWGNRAINGIAFVAFYQGDGFVAENKVFDTFGYAASHSTIKEDIYGYNFGGKKLYSNTKPQNVGKVTYFENTYEAAAHGYSPDPKHYFK